MKLYGMGQSRSLRALWALEESGIPYEYQEVTLQTDSTFQGSAKHPSYLEINSQGKVPTLINGDLIITESLAILNYIARSAPESGLLPNASMASYAKHDELVSFILLELEQPLWTKGKHQFALPEAHRLPAIFDTATFEFAKAIACLEHLYAGGEFAIGNQFSLVDILLAQTLNWAVRFEFHVPEKLLAYKDHHYQRPALQRAMAVIA
jgi:glutathione S-transferase|tara:strand:- start:1465 stop:2088 length:624 start_codon:yes stop_codon:yes gene_type:complete